MRILISILEGLLLIVPALLSVAFVATRNQQKAHQFHNLNSV
jgi:hypothetical protein